MRKIVMVACVGLMLCFAAGVFAADSHHSSGTSGTHKSDSNKDAPVNVVGTITKVTAGEKKNTGTVELSVQNEKDSGSPLSAVVTVNSSTKIMIGDSAKAFGDLKTGQKAQVTVKKTADGTNIAVAIQVAAPKVAGGDSKAPSK